MIRSYTEEANHRYSLAAAEQDVVAQAKSPSTFDDIYSKVYYIPFDLVNEAVDDLVSKGMLSSSETMVTDPRGVTHTVRLFSSRS